ncbi:hypothetical protein FOZ63_018883, partial [Perkinsus olseni]
FMLLPVNASASLRRSFATWTAPFLYPSLGSILAGEGPAPHTLVMADSIQFSSNAASILRHSYLLGVSGVLFGSSSHENNRHQSNSWMRSALRMSMCYKRGGCPVVQTCDLLGAVDELKTHFGYTIAVLGDGSLTDSSWLV